MTDSSIFMLVIAIVIIAAVIFIETIISSWTGFFSGLIGLAIMFLYNKFVVSKT
jgi:hypothetical protein